MEAWKTMVKCALCGDKSVEFSLKGLSGHVRFSHKADWKQYQEKYSPKESEKLIEESDEKDKAEDVVAMVKETMDGVLKSVDEKLGIFRKELGLNLESPTVPDGAVPLEEVEVIGEKVNYRVALNPEIFYLYSVFKAQNTRLAKTSGAPLWKGDFSDWLYLATKELLASYNIHPTVVATSGNKIMIELPTGEG